MAEKAHSADRAGPEAGASRPPRHHVQLLVSQWCHSCPAAEQVWRQVAEERDIRFAVVDMAQPEGRELVARLRLKSVPSVIVDGALAAVGVQSPAEARALVADAPPRPRGVAYHAGIMLARDNRAFIVSSMGYLLLAGVALLLAGGWLPGGSGRTVGAHLFGAGCATMLIFGLGAHMLPRFTGRPVRGGAWGWVQLALAHAGVLGLAGGPLAGSVAAHAAGGAALVSALLVFLLRVWPALWGEDEPVPPGAVRIVPLSPR